MNRELSDEELLYASEEDWAFYKEIADQLPSMDGKNGDGKDKFGCYIPYHSGPHIIRHIKRVIDIVQPARVFEIGFNMGHSASMFLELCSCELISCDISEKDETIEAADILRRKYHDRFSFEWRMDIRKDSYIPYWFDLIFIDGGHEEGDVTKDIQLAKDLGIPYLLFDDIYSRFGPGVLPAISKFDLELVEDMNNLRLYKWKS